MKTERESEEQSSIRPVAGRLYGIVADVMKSSDDHVIENWVDTGININGYEWAALFYDVLHCPTGENNQFTPGDNLSEWLLKRKLEFQQAIPNYPMLSRIWDIYVGASYESLEVEQLRQECLNLQSSTTNVQALKALSKLILNCDEALKADKGLVLAGD